MRLPNDLMYSKEHEWVLEEGSDLRIGNKEFAQTELGDYIFMKLPEVRENMEIDEPFGSVELIKTVSELYALVSGKVVEVNEKLEDSTEFVNESPYDKAWMVIVEPSNDEELDDLLSAEDYEAHISE